MFSQKINTMKKITLLILMLSICQVIFGQDAGNINYQNPVRFSDNNININLSTNADVLISVKGLANIKADTYVAIFSVSQVGKTAEETNTLIEKRIEQATKEIQAKTGVSLYLDMISFVPMYEFEVEKKVFSKNTYNEVPSGFELKKNIHIRYTDPTQLNDFISILSNYEVYDLVRVDYFSSNLENIKKELMDKARLLLQEKIKNYEAILGESFANYEKRMADGYKMMLPAEMYKSYEAYNSSSLTVKKTANTNQANKTKTFYYQPIIDKEFDFVINPTILEPVIQVMYEVKLGINKDKKQTDVIQKEYYLITPNGDLKNLKLNE